PFSPRPVRVGPSALAVVAVTAAGLVFLGPDWRLAITNSGIGAVLCLSLVVLTGFVGQISLAQMTLAGVSGFTLAKLATEHRVPFPIRPLARAPLATPRPAPAAPPRPSWPPSTASRSRSARSPAPPWPPPSGWSPPCPPCASGAS